MNCPLAVFMYFSWFKQVAKNVVPMITCSPWNPVAMKNVDPYAESLIPNSAFQYSIP